MTDATYIDFDSVRAGRFCKLRHLGLHGSHSGMPPIAGEPQYQAVRAFLDIQSSRFMVGEARRSLPCVLIAPCLFLRVAQHADFIAACAVTVIDAKPE